MKKWIRPLAAACALALISARPGSSVRAAQEALGLWAASVVPALTPFLMVAPALTGPEVTSLLARMTGGMLRWLRLPENCPGALLVGLLGGSPGGAAALTACRQEPSDPPGAYLRAAVLASGASPAFLLSSVAAGMLASPGCGWLLIRSQTVAAVLTAALLRSVGKERTAGEEKKAVQQASLPLRTAAVLFNIAGWMVLFSVLADGLSGLLGEKLRTPLLVCMELAGGCRALAEVNAPLAARLPLISAAASFGGISVYMQCMTSLTNLGISYAEYAAAKLIHAALAAAVTCAQMELARRPPDPSAAGLIAVSGILLMVMLRGRTGRTGKPSEASRV